MTMQVIPTNLGKGGLGVATALGGILTELQSLRIAVIGTGAAAGTKMNIAAMRTTDTILAAIRTITATGVKSDDAANLTIQDTHAFGTVTLAAAADLDTVTVAGQVYTFKTTPSSPQPYAQVAILGNNTLTAAALAAQINAFEATRVGGAQVVAVPAVAVVTITAKVDGTAGNALTLVSSNGTRLAVTGAGTLTNGTATGGIKSTTDNSASSLEVFWFNKDGV